MAYEVLDDVLLWADGDYEARGTIYRGLGRRDYALNTKTGSKLSAGWYDRVSHLYNGSFEFCSLHGQRVLRGSASIFHEPLDEWAKTLGVPYSEPEGFREGTIYRNRFKIEYGTFSYLRDLTFPWSDLSDAEIGELREEFMRLLRNIRFWGSGGARA